MSASLYDLIEPLQPFAKALVDLAGRAGVQPRVTSTLRTRAQQQRLYAAYLRGENAYPVAPPGTSAHEYGFAFDMVAATREDLHDLGSLWVQAGGLWSANDEVHFQYPGFVAPATPPQPGANYGLKTCDFLVGLGDLGIAQLADSLAELVAPLHCDDPARKQTIDCQLQRAIQGPCSYIVQDVLQRL